MRNTFGRLKQWQHREHIPEADVYRSAKLASNHTTAKKLVYIVIAILMLVIGLVGIVIPVIPGILFLAGALFYFGKVSPGVRSWSDEHPVLGKVNKRIDRMGELRIMDRIKLGALMSIGAISATISGALKFSTRKIRAYNASVIR